MKKRLPKNIIIRDRELIKKSNPSVGLVGQKARGLMVIPQAWSPPFAVLKACVYTAWIDASTKQQKKQIIEKASTAIVEQAQNWSQQWPRGLILRSSATKETINERGSYISQKLAADYNVDMVSNTVEKIYRNFLKLKDDGSLAIIIQPLVPQGHLGHSSNVRRVSKTINQWEWFLLETPHIIRRFNSKRYDKKQINIIPAFTEGLSATNQKDFSNLLKAVARWCASLNRGRALLEWSWDRNFLWLLQIDFEDESPDLGYDPKRFHREIDFNPPGEIPHDSYIQKIDLNGTDYGWRKIDKVKSLAQIRSDPYPPLFILRGSDLKKALKDKKKLTSDIKAITHGRAVCRTDCNAKNVEKLNLPRTDSSTPKKAVEFFEKAFNSLIAKGAKAKNICFIIHKFIPALASAWSLADPTKQIVMIDSLWGIPDGLQYFSHDSFDVDVKLSKVTPYPRYKPFFMQELKNGQWKRIPIKRNLARGVSLSKLDLIQIAEQSHELAKLKNKPILIMWFCEIPDDLEMGKNLPWFCMPPNESVESQAAAPQRPQFPIRNTKDIKRAKKKASGHILLLEPEVQLIREIDFLDQVIQLAKEQNLPVQIKGSTLCHAYYMLHKAGVEVYSSGAIKYKRTRGKKSFGKLVRDAIPEKIIEAGEQPVLAKIHKQEARAALLIKLFEEAFELKDAQTPEEVKEELADILEVVRSLTLATGTNWKDVEKASLKKRKERGSFQDNVVLLQTSWFSEKSTPQSFAQPIPLKNLISVTDIKNGVEISFPTILLNSEETKITLPNGSNIGISASPSGIKIVEKRQDDLGQEEQLSFPLMEE